jgi:hypothetical protein
MSHLRFKGKRITNTEVEKRSIGVLRPYQDWMRAKQKGT